MRRTRMRANVCVCVYTHMHERSTPLTRKLSSMDHGLRFVHANSIAETTSTAAAVVDGIEDEDDAPSESESGCKTSAMPPKPFVRLERWRSGVHAPIMTSSSTCTSSVKLSRTVTARFSE